VVKKRSILVKMILGEDIRVEKVIESMRKNLMGRIQIRIFNSKRLND
jgi:hypothetical protein